MKRIKILKNVKIPIYFFQKIEYKTFDNFPFVHYSNEKPVNIINSYLQIEENIKLSEASIIKKAYALSSFVEFLEKNKIKLITFNENKFFLFSKFLLKENKKNNRINYILKETLNFLDFAGLYLNIENYSQKILNASKTKEQGYIKSGYQHYALLDNTPDKIRDPISNEDIDKLYQAVFNISDSKFFQKRTFLLLKLLESTGARVSEINNIKIEDIKSISKDNLYLKMRTSKRKINHYRLVPISNSLLNEINMFIKIYRNRVIKNTIGNNKDEGFLFINEKTGKHIVGNTISNTINALKKEAKINHQICAHMFRHRFITNFFIKLIKQYDLENQDDFRNALLDINNLKAHIQQITGHKDVKSLDHYINIAKSEIVNLNNVTKKVECSNNKELIDREKNKLLLELEKGLISKEDYIRSIKKL